MRLALAGDTMLGRLVADAIERSRQPPLAPEVIAVAAEADLFMLNLECCISARGERWPDPRKPAAASTCASLRKRRCASFR
jgi:hypothetical protein